MRLFKQLSIFFALILIVSALAGCASSNAGTSHSNSTQNNSSSSKNKNPSTGSSNSAANRNAQSFTNTYGTATTVCAHSGCTAYIAPSGDTNCCTAHSNRCLNCRKYIDEDAIYCISCLEKAANSNSSSSNSSSNSSSHSSGSSRHSNSGETGVGGYDMPNENESFSDYVKRIDPELYNSLFQ